jgi:hypothetical protein
MKRSFLSLSVLLFMFPVLLCSCDCRKNCAVNTAENGTISQTMPQKKFPSVFPESWKNREFLAHEYKNIKPGIDYFHFHFKEFEDTGKPLSVYLVEIDWNTAKVKAQTAVCGEHLQTVADMVKDKNPVV